MSNRSSIFALFSFLVGVMLFGILSNVYAYAQQSSSSSPTLSAASPPTGSSSSKSVSPELKAKMCDPTNPSLKVVNATESHICGIPRTVKSNTSSANTPKASAVSPSPSIQQAPTTKPTSANITPPKQQQIKAVNNTHVNGISQPAGGAAGTTISQVSRPPSTKTSSSLPIDIAPQIKAVNQPHQPQQQSQLIPITRINATTGTNGTAGQNYTFSASSPAATSGKLLYLGYHDTTATTGSSTHGNSDSKDKSSQNSKPPTHSSSGSGSGSSSSTSSTNDNSQPKKIKRSSSSSTSSGTESSTPPHSRIIVTYNNNSPQTTKTTSTTKSSKNNSRSDNSSPKTDKSNTATRACFPGKKTTRTSNTNSDLTPYYT